MEPGCTTNSKSEVSDVARWQSSVVELLKLVLLGFFLGWLLAFVYVVLVVFKIIPPVLG